MLKILKRTCCKMFIPLQSGQDSCSHFYEFGEEGYSKCFDVPLYYCQNIEILLESTSLDFAGDNNKRDKLLRFDFHP